jgi:esterase/lipase superfamily enzyme
MRHYPLLFVSLLLAGCHLPGPAAIASDVAENKCPTSEVPPAEGSLLFVTLRLPLCPPPYSVEASRYRASRPQFAAALNGQTTLVSEAAWQSTLRRQVALAGGRSPVLFIHGYNNSNGDALVRARAISAAIGGVRPVIALTWPSYDETPAYFWDETNAQWGLTEARQVISDLVEKYPHLIIVAHSMGNHFAVDAITDLRSKNLLSKVDRVVMASADVDRPTLRQMAVPHGLGVPVTMYASAGDEALSFSWRLHGYPRVGDIRNWVKDSRIAYAFADASGVEVVETTALKHGKGDFPAHSDFIETAEGAADLCRVLLGLPDSGARTRVVSAPANYFALAPGVVGPAPCSSNGATAAALATGWTAARKARGLRLRL